MRKGLYGGRKKRNPIGRICDPTTRGSRVAGRARPLRNEKMQCGGEFAATKKRGRPGSLGLWFWRSRKDHGIREVTALDTKKKKTEMPQSP